MRSSLPVCFCLLQENWQVQWILSALSNHNQWSQSIAFPLFTNSTAHDHGPMSGKEASWLLTKSVSADLPRKKTTTKTLQFKSHIQHDQFLLSMPDWKEGCQVLPGIKCLNASSAFPIWTSRLADVINLEFMACTVTLDKFSSCGVGCVPGSQRPHINAQSSAHK